MEEPINIKAANDDYAVFERLVSAHGALEMHSLLWKQVIDFAKNNLAVGDPVRTKLEQIARSGLSVRP